MGRLDCRLTERLLIVVAELRGGHKVAVEARSNNVSLPALCRLNQCTRFLEGFKGVTVSSTSHFFLIMVVWTQIRICRRNTSTHKFCISLLRAAVNIV